MTRLPTTLSLGSAGRSATLAAGDLSTLAEPRPASLTERGAESQSGVVVCLDPLSDPRWTQLLDRLGGSVFHSPAWLRALVATYGFDIRAYVVTDAAGLPCAGVPFCRIEDLRGGRIVVLPFSDYCDPLFSEPTQWQLLVDALVGERLPVTIRSLRGDVMLGDDHLALAKRAHWHGIDLSPPLAEVWQRFHPQARQRIRRAQRDGVTIRAAENEQDLRAFFEMHARVRKYKYRLLPQPFDFFLSIWREFRSLDGSGGIRLLLAMVEDRVIAGTLFLHWHDTLYYKFNASDQDFLRHRPNDLIIWEAIVAGKALGLAKLDFGLSDWGQTGLVHFKRQYASDERVISFVQWMPSINRTAAEREAGELLSAVTTLLTDTSVPDEVTERGGAVLYRFFA